MSRSGRPGAQALTLFCRLDDPAVVFDALRLTGMSVEGGSGGDRVVATSDAGSMRITTRMFEPGGEFSDVILGAHTAVSDAAAEGEATKSVLALLETCDMMLGVVFTPPLGESDQRETAVFRMAAATQALVFDGSAFRDLSGRAVLEIG